jgi:hypothetical protein
MRNIQKRIEDCSNRIDSFSDDLYKIDQKFKNSILEVVK